MNTMKQRNETMTRMKQEGFRWPFPRVSVWDLVTLPFYVGLLSFGAATALLTGLLWTEHGEVAMELSPVMYQYLSLDPFSAHSLIAVGFSGMFAALLTSYLVGACYFCSLVFYVLQRRYGPPAPA